MTSLVPYRPTGPNGHDRALARLEFKGELELATIQQQADLQTARVQAVAYVGCQGLRAVAMVSELEGKLGQLCPLAVSRLQAIGDIAALSVAEVVTETFRMVR